MNDELLNALDESLSAILAGESVGACLARYPMLADDLRPMLEAALAAQQLSADVTVPPAAQNASRARFLARAAELRSPTPRRSWWAALTPRLLVNALGLLVAFSLGAYSVAAVSAESLPGEVLYGVKRMVEQTQLSFTFNPQDRAQLQEQLTARRVEEVREVLATGRVTDLEFGGVIEELNGERWTVAGLTVMVPAEASLTGVPVVGLFVEVEGQTQSNGLIRASAVRVTGLVFRGLINAIGGETWQVGERLIWINAQTQLVGAMTLGDEVDVTARQLGDGVVVALRVELVASQIAPTTTPTALPTATQLPSITPITSIAPTATPTTSPTRTLSPTPTRTPDSTLTVEDEVEVEFTGLVEAVGATAWQIGGQTVLITTETEIRDNPQVGDLVEVRALRDAQGVLTATRIRLEDSGPSGSTSTSTPGSGGGPTPTPVIGTPGPTQTPDVTNTDEPPETEFEGTVTAINGNIWTIGGQQVIVTGDTELQDNPGLGSFVEVRAWQYPDGTLVARRIRVR